MYLLYSVNVYIILFKVVIEIKFYSILFYSNYGSLGKTVLQDTLSADLVAEEYLKVSLANRAGDESDCFSALDGF